MDKSQAKTLDEVMIDKELFTHEEVSARMKANGIFRGSSYHNIVAVLTRRKHYNPHVVQAAQEVIAFKKMCTKMINSTKQRA